MKPVDPNRPIGGPRPPSPDLSVQGPVRAVPPAVSPAPKHIPKTVRPSSTSMVVALEPGQHPASQRRRPGQDSEDAARRHFDLPGSARDIRRARPESAYGEAVPWKDLDTSRIPLWPDLATLQERFERIRDERFVPMEGAPDFPRRISWLYPDDGCFARAGMSKRLSREWAYEQPQRVFIFGNLEVETPNHPSGEVSWWYHTAPVVRVGEEIYVLDPAVEPDHPLTLEQWSQRQVTTPSRGKYAVCNADTYAPRSDCDAPPDSEAQAAEDQEEFLPREWRRQRELGRDPREVLGDRPPWAKPVKAKPVKLEPGEDEPVAIETPDAA